MQNYHAPRLRVLIVDQDPQDRRRATEYLKMQRIGVVMSTDKPSDIIPYLTEFDCDLVTLDLSTNPNATLTLLSNIRSRFNSPLLATVPSYSGEALRVATLELGADDCIAKPFGLGEFLARIRALLRRRVRQHERDPSPGLPEPRHCRFGDWQLDPSTRQLAVVSGDSCVRLSKGEHTLLAAFLHAPLVVLSREHLLHAANVDEDSSDRSIDTRIMRLRRKLRPTPEMPEIIRTVHGFGYMFMLDVEDIV
ncbi:winged helix-turn-helix domain-containing protein [Bradyrhizobium sp. Tv2a-2]|uniref:winged helix-turn-helix domain-containing protein n=1 Tax=Bradyrhizobium sp. Tv2a-2 TaxID=113395 RepID=UPI000463402F|nr:winged helix-turn-helix domain-containing protein [Bradyrhizobium sp. Tv2a-2]